jgi:hypothetical protein
LFFLLTLLLRLFAGFLFFRLPTFLLALLLCLSLPYTFLLSLLL